MESFKSIVEHLPQYKSKKIVRAVKIAAYEVKSDSSVVMALALPDVNADSIITISAEDWAKITARSSPEEHDYLVIYEDSYVSWSPEKAFEEGYDAL